MIVYSLKLLLCVFGVGVGTMLGGMLSAGLGLQRPQMPPGLDMRLLGLWTTVAGLGMSIGLAEIARRITGGKWVRWLTLAWFTYTCMGINNTIEALTFTSIGGGAFMAVSWLPTSFLLGGLAALLFRGQEQEPRPLGAHLFTNLSLRNWPLRLAGAWFAFPAVYIFFGIPVGLIFQRTYQDEAFGLRLPSVGVVIGVQVLRSTLFLLGSLPILAVWSGGRRRFWVVFGLAMFLVVGFFGLVQAYWMPWAMRGLHSFEILLDSLAYAWLLGVLLLRRPGAEEAGRPASSAEP